MIVAYSPEQYSAFWDGVVAIATAVATLAAILTFIALVRNDRARTRAVMVAELSPEVFAPQTIELIVSNVGRTSAKEVEVTFTPPLPAPQGASDPSMLTAFLVRRYEKPISMVAPGQRLYNIYSAPNEASNPKEVHVKFDYKDYRGKKCTVEYDLSSELIQGQSHGPGVVPA